MHISADHVATGASPGWLTTNAHASWEPTIECPTGLSMKVRRVERPAQGSNQPEGSFSTTSPEIESARAKEYVDAAESVVANDTLDSLLEVLNEKKKLLEKIKLETAASNEPRSEPVSRTNESVRTTPQNSAYLDSWNRLSELNGQIRAQTREIEKLSAVDSFLKVKLDEAKSDNLKLDVESSQLRARADKAVEAKQSAEKDSSLVNAWFVSAMTAAAVILAGTFLGLIAVFFVQRYARAKSGLVPTSSDDAAWNRMRIEEDRLLARMTRFVPFILVCIGVLSSFLVLVYVLTERSSVIEPLRGGTMFATLGVVFAFSLGTAKWHSNLEAKLRSAIKLDGELSASSRA
jgi:hypothetical protein